METFAKGVIAVILLAGLAWIASVFFVDTAFFQDSFLVVFPAVFALKALPVIGTFVDILLWVAIFELTLFTMKLLLRLMEWVQLSGRTFVD